MTPELKHGVRSVAQRVEAAWSTRGVSCKEPTDVPKTTILKTITGQSRIRSGGLASSVRVRERRICPTRLKVTPKLRSRSGLLPTEARASRQSQVSTKIGFCAPALKL